MLLCKVMYCFGASEAVMRFDAFSQLGLGSCLVCNNLEGNFDIIKKHGGQQLFPHIFAVFRGTRGIMIMELFETSLSAGMPVSQDLLASILVQLETALGFLHQRCGLVHCDMKPANVLLNQMNFRAVLVNLVVHS